MEIRARRHAGICISRHLSAPEENGYSRLMFRRQILAAEGERKRRGVNIKAELIPPALAHDGRAPAC
jgi:hypothetical protein